MTVTEGHFRPDEETGGKLGTAALGRVLPRRGVISGIAALAALSLAAGCTDRRICRDIKPSGQHASRLAVVPCPGEDDLAERR